MGFWGGVGSALSSFGKGVLDVTKSMALNPDFQKAAIGLGTQYLRQKMTPSPKPSTYAIGPTYQDLVAQQRAAAYSQLQVPTWMAGGVARTPVSRGAVRAIPSVVTEPAPAGLQPLGLPTTNGRLRMASLTGSPVPAARSVYQQLLPGGLQGMQGFQGFTGGSVMDAILPAVGTIGGGLLPEITERLGSLAQVVTGDPTNFFRYGETRARPSILIEARHPQTGRIHYWRHMGRPILFSGDLANCRRVGKVQGRLNRARPRKR